MHIRPIIVDMLPHFSLALLVLLVLSGCSTLPASINDLITETSASPTEAAITVPSHPTETNSPVKITSTPALVQNTLPSPIIEPSSTIKHEKKTPSLSTLQVINRTNINKIVPLWQLESLNGQDEEKPTSFVFHPDGKRIAFLDNNKISLLDLETAKITQIFSMVPMFAEVSQPKICNWLFSPGGNRLAASTSQGLVLWDVSTGEALWKADSGNAENYSPEIDAAGITSIDFSPGGDFLVTTSIQYGSDIRVWSAQTGKLIKEFGQPNQLDASFSPDGTLLYTVDRVSAEEAIRIWDTQTWQQTGVVNIPRQATRIFISPNGKQIIVGHMDVDRSTRALELFSLDEWKQLGLIEDRDPASMYQKEFIAVDFNRDWEIVAFVTAEIIDETAKQVQLWDLANQTHLRDLEDNVSSSLWLVRFSPDGRLLATQSENGITTFWGVPMQ